MYKYLNNASPTGFESPGQQIWLDYMKPYSDEYIVDTYGSVAAVINPGQKYKVVIEAHADEIAWFVHYITKDGFIYLKRKYIANFIFRLNFQTKFQISKRQETYTSKEYVRRRHTLTN